MNQWLTGYGVEVLIETSINLLTLCVISRCVRGIRPKSSFHVIHTFLSTKYFINRIWFLIGQKYIVLVLLLPKCQILSNQLSIYSLTWVWLVLTNCINDQKLGIRLKVRSLFNIIISLYRLLKWILYFFLESKFKQNWLEDK